MCKMSFLQKNIYVYMSLARRLKRQQEHEVKKMYEREMRKMSTMTNEQKITHLAHLQARFTPVQQNNNMVQTIEPIDVTI